MFPTVEEAIRLGSLIGKFACENKQGASTVLTRLLETAKLKQEIE